MTKTDLSSQRLILGHEHSRPDIELALHGEALLMAGRPELRPLIDQLAEQTQGRDDISLECAGVIARSRFAGSARRGEDYETKIRRLGRREGRLPVSHQTTRKEEDRTRTPAPMITNYG